MKVLWLAHRDPGNPNAGGAELTIYEVCRRLVSQGNIVTVLAGGWKGAKKIEIIEGIRIIRFGKNIAVHLIAPIILLKDQFDLVVSDLGHAVPWLTPTIFRLDNIVFFRHLHARSLRGQVNPLLAKFISSLEKCYFLLYKNDVFVTESNASVRDLMGLGIKKSNITRIAPGVDKDLFKPSSKTKFPSIVYFGGMRKYKRPEEVLFLLKSTTHLFPNILLYMLGDGPERKRLEMLAIKLGLSKRCVFLGRVDRKELAKIVSESWLNIHTSLTEGWGYSIMEASAAGTPTVAYRVPGVDGTIDEGLNGIKVYDGDRDALIQSSIEIIRSPEKWWESSPRAVEKYSWEFVISDWQNKVINKYK